MLQDWMSIFLQTINHDPRCQSIYFSSIDTHTHTTGLTSFKEKNLIKFYEWEPNHQNSVSSFMQVASYHTYDLIWWRIPSLE